MVSNLSYLEEIDRSSDEEAGPVRFAPVTGDEMAFAMSLFVGAANGELAQPQTDTISAQSSGERDRLLRTLSRGTSGMLQSGAGQPYLSSLEEAFRGVWSHYEGDERQASVCARVLGFYYLMEESGGAVIERWVSACEGSEEVVVLHPAVVETLAAVPLSALGGLTKGRFVSLLEVHAM